MKFEEGEVTIWKTLISYNKDTYLILVPSMLIVSS